MRASRWDDNVVTQGVHQHQQHQHEYVSRRSRAACIRFFMLELRLREFVTVYVAKESADAKSNKASAMPYPRKETR